MTERLCADCGLPIKTHHNNEGNEKVRCHDVTVEQVVARAITLHISASHPAEVSAWKGEA